MMLAHCAVLLALAQAPTPEITVGVFAPSLYFQDAQTKATFLTQLEQSLSTALQANVRAQSATQFSQVAGAQLWLIDGALAAAQLQSMRPARQMVVRGRNSQPMAVYALESGEAASLIQNRAVLVPGGSGPIAKANRYWVVLDEPGVGRAMERAPGRRDVRAALTAVLAKEAKAALAPDQNYGKLDPSLSRLKRIASLRELPTAVLGINQGKVKGGQLESYARALSKAALPTLSGVITGWKQPDQTTLNALRSSIQRRRSPVPRIFYMADVGALEIDLRGELPPPPEPTPLNPIDFIPAPPAPDFPDPPEEAADIVEKPSKTTP